jgi:hypothetical protein
LKEFLIFFEGNSGQKKEKIRKLPSSEMEALVKSVFGKYMRGVAACMYF